MAVNGAALAALIKTKMDTKFKTVVSYSGPLAQQNPSYFIQFCDALGNGIIQGNPVINFTSNDTGIKGTPPVVGVGVGVGVIVDTAWFTNALYAEIRSKVIDNHGSTNHPSSPQGPYNFLTAVCEAISEGVTTHYASARILQSTHQVVYAGAGAIMNGGFSGVSASGVASAIQGLGSNMQGSFWPILCQAVGKIYSDAIQLHSTGTVTITGVCVPSQSQTCGVPSTGTGTGTAS